MKHNAASPRVLKQSDSNKKSPCKEPLESAHEYRIWLRNEIKNMQQQTTTKEIKEHVVFTKQPKIPSNAHSLKGSINLKLHIIWEEHNHSDSPNLAKQVA